MVGASLCYGLWGPGRRLAHARAASATVVLAFAGLLLALIRPAGRPLDQWLVPAALRGFAAQTTVAPLAARILRLPVPTTQGWAELAPRPDWIDSGDKDSVGAPHIHHIEAPAMNASVQARLDLLALEGGIARFGTARNGHAISVLDLVGSEASMSTADDATQEELLAGRAQFLNAQTAAFQVLVRTEPVDLDGHLRRVQARAERLAEPLASVARDYVTFVQTLAFQRTLLERHCYVVLPDQTERPVVSLSRRLRGMFIAGPAQMKLATIRFRPSSRGASAPGPTTSPPAWPVGTTHAPALEPATGGAATPLLVA